MGRGQGFGGLLSAEAETFLEIMTKQFKTWLQ